MVGFVGSFIMMFRKRKSVKEMSLFAVLSLLSFIVWMGIFLQQKLNPNEWIGRLIDWMKM
jgi:hypothetical protein